VAGLAGRDQVWESGGWAEKFDLPLDPTDTGYGHGPDDVAAVRAEAQLLLGYFEDVHGQTLQYVGALAEEDLTRVVDQSWDPPVTVSIRLVSVLADDLQHVGQAAYVRGIVQQL
jgi:hypothetical protein